MRFTNSRQINAYDTSIGSACAGLFASLCMARRRTPVATKSSAAVPAATSTNTATVIVCNTLHLEMHNFAHDQVPDQLQSQSRAQQLVTHRIVDEEPRVLWVDHEHHQSYPRRNRRENPSRHEP